MRDEPSENVSEWWTMTVEGERMTEFVWGDQGLTGAIPAEIGAPSAPRYLNLYGNELNSSIPPTIGALTNLKGLYLSNNPLSGVIPSTLSNLTNLQYLSLYETALTNRPDAFFR